MMTRRKIDGAVVLVTGATSGIGREAALKFADAGADLILAARREDKLKELAAEIEDGGNQALAIVTDIGVSEQVERMIDQAAERFGRLDVLVNNAGVTMGARFDEQSMDDFRRIMDVNFWGPVHACRKAVPLMKKQPDGGVIINVSSMNGRRPTPYATAYASSKAALNGFSQALRMEVMSDKIDVCTLLPGAVDTEIFEAFANQSGYDFPTSFPKTSAAAVAEAIVNAAIFPKPEIIIGLDANLTQTLNSIAPGWLDIAIGKNLAWAEKLFPRSKSQDDARSSGNLYRPHGQ